MKRSISHGRGVGFVMKLLSSVFAFTLSAANAQDSKMMLTGADFLSACSRPDSEWIGFCHGYVQAVVDGVRMPGESFCVPVGTTRAEIVGTVVDKLVKRPNLQKLNAASVVYSVLAEAYPCR